MTDYNGGSGSRHNNNDNYIYSQEKKLLSFEQTGLSGLITFGHAKGEKAELPLLDHFHRERAEFVILVDGMQEYTASGINYTLYGGDMFFTPPNEVHSSGNNKQSNNEILWFQLDMSEALHGSFLNLQGKQSEHVYSALKGYNARRTSLSRKLIESFLEAFELLSDSSVHGKIKGQALFVYCLLSVFEERAQGKTISEEINAARQYITEHIRESIMLDELLPKSGLNASEFKAKFKEQIGFLPREYIAKTKIDAAKRAVALTSVSISDIAFSYSFSSGRYFCRVFKQYTGLSPNAYRRSYKKGRIDI